MSHATEKPYRLADSSFRSESSPNITHATDETGDRTLCGRDATDWTSESHPGPGGPDCLTCARVWRKRKSKSKSQAAEPEKT